MILPIHIDLLGNRSKLLSHSLQTFILAVAVLVLGSCTAFKQEKLFQSEEAVNSDSFNKSLSAVEGGYRIQEADILAISIYPNKGEMLVDQTGDYPSNDIGGTDVGMQNLLQQQSRNVQGGEEYINVKRILFSNMEPLYYNVNEAGEIDLPVVGRVNVKGLGLRELDSLLSKQYASYIKKPYVVSQFVNKRVVLMGALGDRVVALNNGGTSLLEVISLSAGGGDINGAISSLQRDAKASEIRIIRGEPGQRQVMVVDLTTMEGLNKLQTKVYPNDIIYLPPRRRFDRQMLSDISSILTPILTALTLLTSVVSLTSRNP